MKLCTDRRGIFIRTEYLSPTRAIIVYELIIAVVTIASLGLFLISRDDPPMVILGNGLWFEAFDASGPRWRSGRA